MRLRSLSLLWLWRRPAATAPIQPLAWDRCSPKKTKEKEKKKRKEKKTSKKKKKTSKQMKILAQHRPWMDQGVM